MSKRLGGIKGCKYKTSSWHLNRFPDADNNVVFFDGTAVIVLYFITTLFNYVLHCSCLVFVWCPCMAITV